MDSSTSTTSMSSNSSLGFVTNKHLDQLQNDVLYHLGISRTTMDLPKVFGDVKYVITGGSANRMKVLSNFFADKISEFTGERVEPTTNLCDSSDRYVMYKVGTILCINHGIGIPSLSVMLNELFKLLHYSECDKVTMFRIGTSGGVGIEPGTVVVSVGGINWQLENCYEYYKLGVPMRLPAIFDEDFVNELLQVAEDKHFDFSITTGLTLGTNDFYEGQGRLDGSYCDYDNDQKQLFLDRLYKMGVRNIEMESVGFAALTKRAGIKSAIICVALINRLNGDQVTTPKTVLKSWETRPAELVWGYIEKDLLRK